MVRKYKVGEISRFFGISRDTVHYYDSFGIFPASRDSENNYRYYTREDVVFFHHISMLRDLGIPLEDIKASVSDNDIAAQRQIIDSRRDKIEAEISQLQQQLCRLDDYKTVIARLESGLLQPTILKDLTAVYCEPDYTGGRTYKDIVEAFHAVDSDCIPMFAFLSYRDWFSEDTVNEYYRYSENMLELREQDIFRIKEDGIFQRASMCIIMDHVPEAPLPPGFKTVTANRWLQISFHIKLNEDYSALVFFLDQVLQNHYEPAGDCFFRAASLRNRPDESRDYYEVLFPIKD